MPSFGATLPDLVIASAAQASTVKLDSVKHTGDAIAIAVQTPVGGIEVYKFRISFDEGVTWSDLEDRDGSGLLSLPAAGCTRVYFELPAAPMLEIYATSAVAADRTFKLYKLFQYF